MKCWEDTLGNPASDAFGRQPTVSSTPVAGLGQALVTKEGKHLRYANEGHAVQLLLVYGLDVIIEIPEIKRMELINA